MVLGRDFEQIQGVWTLCSPPLNNSINSFFLCICEQEFFLKYKFFLVHRSNFYSNSSFNSSLKKHDRIAISHYVFKLVHLFLVHLLDCFGVISPSMLWTSNFGKLKVRMYFIVHGLDVLNICSSVGWMVLKSFAKVFISSYIWTSVPCNEGQWHLASVVQRRFSSMKWRI